MCFFYSGSLHLGGPPWSYWRDRAKGAGRRTVLVLRLAVVSVFVQPQHPDHAALPGGRHTWHGARGAKGAEQDADVDSTTDAAT